MSDVVSSNTLKLLQALNDKDSKSISELIKSKNVKTWIDNKVSVKRIKNPRIKYKDDFEYCTCLTFACWYCHVQTVRQLVEAGADVTATDSSKCIPIHRACLSKIDAKEKVTYLFQSAPSMKIARHQLSNTPLHYASCVWQR